MANYKANLKNTFQKVFLHIITFLNSLIYRIDQCGY